MSLCLNFSHRIQITLKVLFYELHSHAFRQKNTFTNKAASRIDYILFCKITISLQPVTLMFLLLIVRYRIDHNTEGGLTVRIYGLFFGHFVLLIK